MAPMMVLAFVLSSLMAVCMSVTALEVMTTTGPVRGEVVSESLRFLGIPYARPPLGTLRFRPPEPPEPWTEVRGATAFGHVCMQASASLRGFDMSEDCLTLNIHLPKPEISRNEKRAVMVWIHGGYWAAGAGAWEDIEQLSMRGDIIGVTFNYRLGMFGFLTTGDEEIKGNAGFLDQVMALEWIRDNIEEFGGDKSRVTIFGESAGGLSVSAHVLSPLSRGLFRRAISQSGVLDRWSVPLYTEKREKVLAHANRLGCDISSTTAMLSCLEKLDAQNLVIQNSFYFLTVLGPVVDGVFFQRPLPDLWRDFKNPDGIDYLAGLNNDEGDLVLWNTNPEYETTDLQYGISAARLNTLIRMMFFLSTTLTPAQFDIIYDQYIIDDVTDMGRLRAMIDMVRDAVFLAPTITALDAISRSGATGLAYLYYFQQKTPESKRSALDSYRAGHGGEMAYVFGQVTEERGYIEEDRIISDDMMEAWTTFSKTGKPQVTLANETILSWPPYDVTNKTYLSIQYPMTSESVKHRLLPRATSFWNVIAPLVNRPPPDEEDKEDKEDKDVNCEDDSPSRISRDQAETALFILMAVVIVLLLASAILLANYCSIKKQSKTPEDKTPIFMVETEHV